MTKKNLIGPLEKSLQAEESAVDDRFAKADLVLGAGGEQKTNQPEQKVERAVRDGFSFPPEEHERLFEVRDRAAQKGFIASKSEIIRAALRRYSELPDEELISSLKDLQKLKPGRPVETV